MESAAFLIGLFIAAIGVLATVTPEGLVSVIRYLVTPVGLYFVAGFRIATGVIFFRAAPASRTPRVLRVLGSIIFTSGLITPFVGSERARAIVDWWSAQGSLAMRAWAAVAILLGAFVACTVSSGRRADRTDFGTGLPVIDDPSGRVIDPKDRSIGVRAADP